LVVIMAFFPCVDSVDFRDNVLLLPALTLGNVGQFAIDLLVSTTSATRVGFIEDPHIIPVAGNDTFTEGPGCLSTAIEVYQIQHKRITFVQQRSPVIRGHNRIFAKNLTEWIKNSGFREIILLVSADATYRNDAQLFGQQLRYIITSRLENTHIPALFSTWNIPPLESTSYDVVFKKGSVTEGIFEESKEKLLPLLVFALFVNEGDNIPDSITLIDYVNKYLKIVDQEGPVDWKPPNSWALIQGTPVNVSLFQ